MTLPSNILPPPSSPGAVDRPVDFRASSVGADGRPFWTRLGIFRGLPSDTLDQIRVLLDQLGHVLAQRRMA